VQVSREIIAARFIGKSSSLPTRYFELTFLEFRVFSAVEGNIHYSWISMYQGMDSHCVRANT